MATPTTNVLPTWNGCTPGASVPGTSSTLGDLKTAAGITAGAASAAAGIMGALSATATATAIATGIGAAVVALVGIGYAIAGIFSGCGQTCVLSTEAANAAGDRLNAILSAYKSAPVHYVSLQRGALTLVVGTMQALCNACSNPALGDAGKRCISERLVRGGTAPWCPNAGHVGCDYLATFYDPIANDKTVVPDPVSAGAAGPQPTSSVPSAPIPVATAPAPAGTVAPAPTAAVTPMGDNSAMYIVGAVLLLAILKKAHDHGH